MSLSSLTPGGLYIILFIRGDPPEKDNFHWGLYLHHSAEKGGTKYHIKQQGSGWITDHGPTAGVFKSFLLIGLFRVATIPEGWDGYVDGQLRTYDASINMPGMTCRVWVLKVLALLQKEVQGRRVLNCSDLDELEEEVKQWGNSNAVSASRNDQPRPVGRSSKPLASMYPLFHLLTHSQSSHDLTYQLRTLQSRGFFWRGFWVFIKYPETQMRMWTTGLNHRPWW